MPKPTHTRYIRPAFVALIALVTAGCGMLYKQPIYQGNLIEKSTVEQLQAGMSKQDVMTLLGTPSISDPNNQNRWDYTATQRTNRRGDTIIKNFTVWFENGTVSRWEGDYFEEQDDALAQNARRQFGPNLAREDKKKRRR
ncbi:MAG: outer membrane protein assembly factor BamE [Lysobacteraceae bacterium]|nr:MAG: outer membrane protein assembly factor BamE [Xanthomonadaceae bacterium]